MKHPFTKTRFRLKFPGKICVANFKQSKLSFCGALPTEPRRSLMRAYVGGDDGDGYDGDYDGDGYDGDVDGYDGDGYDGDVDGDDGYDGDVDGYDGECMCSRYI